MVIYTMAYKYMFEVGGPVEQLFSVFGQEAPYWLADEKLSYFLIAGYCLWVGTGYNILIFGGAMANINSEVIEYAKLDGVGMTRELFQIILPMIWPTISVAFIGSVTTIFTLFMQVDLIGGDNSYAPRTIAYLLNYAVQTQPEYAATIGICFTVIATPMILVVRKGIDLIGKKFGY
jgi:ABC-type sugar transport system permease subunit